MISETEKITRNGIRELSIDNAIVNSVLSMYDINKDITWEDAINYLVFKLVEQNTLLKKKLIEAEMTR